MKFSIALILTAALSVFVVSPSFAQSGMRQTKQKRQLELGQAVPESNQVSIDAIDHSAWNGLLQTYVNETGGVDYAGWKASAADIQKLDQYLSYLSTASLTKPATKSNQMAFWINAYNSVTVKGILQEYPTKSIRDHTSKLGGYNLWKDLKLDVGGRQASPDDIENKVLRKMGDPRIHFAIVCAAKSCPWLVNEAYVGDKLNEQLDSNARAFFGQPKNFQYDPRARTFKISSIMEWFATDFGPSQAEQLKAIAAYLPTAEAQAAALQNAVSVSYAEYDWSLNKQDKMQAQQGSQSRPPAGSGTSGSGQR